MRLSVRRTAALVGISSTLIAGGTVVAATQSDASARDGVCSQGRFYYYNSNQQGSVSDFSGSVAVYGNTQPDC